MDNHHFIVKCIFCGLCVSESSLNDHMKVYHKIKSLYLKPQQREASTQIAEEDRHFIYPGKRKLLDIKFLTSTPKKSKLEKVDISLSAFNEQDTIAEVLPKIEPKNGCNEDTKTVNNLQSSDLGLRFKCPSCDHRNANCENVLVHIQTIHSGDDRDVRPVRQRMGLVLKQVKLAKNKMDTQVEYYRKFGGLYLHSGVMGHYQCVLKSVHNMRDIRNIGSDCDRNNIPMQDYSADSFNSLKDFNAEEVVEFDENINIIDGENEVCIFCKKMLTKMSLEDHIKREHKINDTLALTTLINMSSDNEQGDKDPVDAPVDVSENNKNDKYYVTDEIVTDKEDDLSINVTNPATPAQHNHCCNSNDSKLNMKFECNWCMKTYNCRFHRNFHENKCNLTYELEKQDPGNADEISLSVFGIRFRCPLCDHHSDKRKDVRDHIVDFHQGYSKRSGLFVEPNPIRQEMRIVMNRKKVEKVHKKLHEENSKHKQDDDKFKHKTFKQKFKHCSQNKTSQLKVNKQLTDEIKAELNDIELERESPAGNNIMDNSHVNIEVNNEVNDEVKDEIHSDMNNYGCIRQGEEEEACNDEIVEILEDLEEVITEANVVGLKPSTNHETDKKIAEDIKETRTEAIVQSNQSTNDEKIQEEEKKESKCDSRDISIDIRGKGTVAELDGIILEQVEEGSDAELTENELHSLLESCQMSTIVQNTLRLEVKNVVSLKAVEVGDNSKENDAASDYMSLLPSWRPWSASPASSRQEETEYIEDGWSDSQVGGNNETENIMTEDNIELVSKELTTESNVLEQNCPVDSLSVKHSTTINAKSCLGESQQSRDISQAEQDCLVEAVPSPGVGEMLDIQKPPESPSNKTCQVATKDIANQDQSNSEFEEDNMSIASFHSFNEPRIKSKVKTRSRSKSKLSGDISDSEKAVSNSTFDEDPSDYEENMLRPESQSSDSSIAMVYQSNHSDRKTPLSDVQNVPGPSRPCQCPFCPAKFDTAKQMSVHTTVCKGRLMKGTEYDAASDDTASTTTTTMAESETSMRPPPVDWSAYPRSIKTAKMSDIKSNVTNVYIRFVQTYYSSYKRRFPDLSSADLMQKLCEGYRILRATNHQSVRTLQMEYERERKAKFSDKIRTIVRSLEEDGCANFNTSLNSGRYSCNRLTP